MDVGKLEVSPTWTTDPIPKVIHQTAPEDTSTWHPLWHMCQRTWKEKFPDYQYRFWTDADIDEFMRTRCSWFYHSFVGFRHQIQRVDAFRYFMLYELGGIYADMDYECVRPFGDILPVGKVSIGENTHWPERFQNALMASAPRHPFWLHVFDALLKSYTKQMEPSFFHSVLYTAGPGMMELAWQSAPEHYIHPLPKEQFAYFDKRNSAMLSKRMVLEPITDPNVYAAHHCTVAWALPNPGE